MALQIDRHWRLLKLLPDHAWPKATEHIWRELQSDEVVSKRTVERDLAMLASIFPIGQTSEGRTNYWYWEAGAKIWLPGLTIDEALALHMVERNLVHLLPESTVKQLGQYFRAAKDRLDRMPKGVIPWTKKFRLIEAKQTLIPATVKADAARAIQDGLIRGHSVTIAYRERGGRKQHVAIVSPLAIVQRGVELYLVYLKLGEAAPQFLPLQRVGSARPSMERYEVPEGFDIDHYIENGALGFGQTYPIPVGRSLKLDAIFDQKSGERLMETPLSPGQLLVPHEDGFRLTAQVKFSAQLAWWLLSYGDCVEVLGPRELRTYMANVVGTLYQRYARTGAGSKSVT
jgi:predicted DNA-binding transcriptional regulator YafY